MSCSMGQGTAQVPGDYYSDLLALGLIPEPYDRQNPEGLKNVPIDPVYTRTFTYTPTADIRRAVLRLEGVDTYATITLNGQVVGDTNNAHRTWDYEVLPLLIAGENTLQVTFQDPRPVFAEHHRRRPLRGADDSIDGYQGTRKPHFMSGWDFSPEMVNAGLFRPVELRLYQEVGFAGVTLRQQTDRDRACITVKSRVQATEATAATLAVTVTDPDGVVVAETRQDYAVADVTRCDTTITVENPRLWWPNGLGDQPLYTVTTTLLVEEREVDRDVKTIGLRSLVCSTAEDAYGREFTFTVNGLTPFIKGANYIPEDCMPARWNRDKTRRLLADCAEAHFNMIRVWGGGFYPEDWFYDLCDELGLLVWQDVMFACCFIDDAPALLEGTKRELSDNLWRFSHRSCLALLCGNNEIEEAMTYWDTWCDVADARTRETYLTVFEREIPACIQEAEVETTYIPSSPTSGGGFDDPGNRSRLDCHDWQVFHGGAPMEVYRRDKSRFLSEFGFQAIPSVKTLAAYMDQPLTVDSPEMEYRNCCHKGNGYLMGQVRDYYSDKPDFPLQVYLTQRMQADSVAYAIHHLRRHRGRCMGTLYWQINDCWPGISWSSIDYAGRWKALHYAAREFYAPYLLTLTEEEGKVTFSLSNEDTVPFTGRVEWRLIQNDLTQRQAGAFSLSVDPLSAKDLAVEDFSHLTAEKKRQCVVVATLLDAQGKVIGEQVARFVYAKEFGYLPAGITATLSQQEGQYTLTLQAENFAQDVWLEFGSTDCVFSRNGFSLTGQPVTVNLSRIEGATPQMEDLQILCLNDTLY